MHVAQNDINLLSALWSHVPHQQKQAPSSTSVQLCTLGDQLHFAGFKLK